MLYIVIIVLLIIVVISGVSSSAQSYATAQQAQAQIETAKVAQVSAWGNLITILTLTLVIIFVLMLIAGVLWIIYKRRSQPAAAHSQRSMTAPRDGPQLTINDLVQLELLRSLRALNPPSPALPAQTQDVEDSPVEELFPWLRK